MKTCFKAILLLAITALIFSCSEEEAEPSAAINEAQSLGRWETTLVRYEYYDAEGEFLYDSEAQREGNLDNLQCG